MLRNSPITSAGWLRGRRMWVAAANVAGGLIRGGGWKVRCTALLSGSPAGRRGCCRRFNAPTWSCATFLPDEERIPGRWPGCLRKLYRVRPQPTGTQRLEGGARSPRAGAATMGSMAWSFSCGVSTLRTRRPFRPSLLARTGQQRCRERGSVGTLVTQAGSPQFLPNCGRNCRLKQHRFFDSVT